MFWEIPGSKPVWLSVAFSELKITTNSTYWKAKAGKDGLDDGTGVRYVIEGKLRAVKKFSRAFFKKKDYTAGAGGTSSGTTGGTMGGSVFDSP